MTAQIIEKGNGTITVQYKVDNGMEALLLSMTSMEVRDTTITLSSFSHGDSQSISIGNVTIKSLAVLETK